MHFCFLANVCGSDLEKQMARCYERIAENIMPDIFKSRLDAFQAIRNEQM
jgi:hypothetical protein